MSNPYCITEAQKAALNQLICERLTSDPANEELVKTFTSQRSENLTQQFRAKGWREDARGTTAYYVVKNRAGELLLYFSLKCGVLFDPTYLQMALSMQQKGHLQADPGDTDKQRIEEFVGYSDEEFEAAEESFDELRYKKRRTIKTVRDILKDLEVEPNDKVIQADESHSAIELVNLCVNDNARAFWSRLGMGSRRMGVTLFWWFVVPKMMEIAEVAGCEYVYSFVPNDPKILSYSKEMFHAQKLDRFGVVKSTYYMGCTFMYNRLVTLNRYMLFGESAEDRLGLNHYRSQFLENFNRTADETTGGNHG